MTYTAQTPLRGLSRGDPDRIAAWAIGKGAARPDDVRVYLTTVYKLAPQLGLNADVVAAQSVHETTDLGIPWNSVWWRGRCNPAGIGITGDARQNAVSRDFGNGDAAAMAHLLHLHLYVAGDTVPSGFLASDDPRWQAAIDAGYAGIADTLDDLTGRWAVDDRYGEKIARTLNELEAAGLLSAKEITTMATHRYILSAGHRNTNGGGARNEITWTYPSVVALKAAIEARGGKAWIVQEEDGDKDPTRFLNGGLQAAATKCVTLEKAFGPFDAYISSHYNGGAAPGFHAIFPDSPTGGVDVKANNPLDVRLCRAIRDRVKATNTVRMLSWTADSPGVMSERETGVGSKGYRLGEFYGTMGFREHVARVIIEASSIDVPSEARYINDPDWVRTVYCEAIVDALEDVFGKFNERPEVPQPQPVPAPQFDEAAPIPELETLPAYLKLANGAQLVRVDHTVKALRDTPRLKYASKDAPRIGPDVKAGELFDVAYLIINADGSMYWYSPWATRFVFEDAVPYAPDVDEAVAA